MLNHIVFFKLKPELSEIEKQKGIKEIVNKMKTLPKLIKEIKEYKIALNKLTREGAYDIILMSKFENEKDLEIYRNHVAHLELVSVIAKYKEKSNYVDFFEEEYFFKA